MNFKFKINRLIFISIVLLHIGFSQITILDSIVPPVAPVVPKTDTLHNEIRIDNYYWLRNKNNPEVIAYLNAENEYTEKIMETTQCLQDTLYQEMLNRIKETDLSVPEKIGDYFYYTRTEQKKQYAIYCRKKGSLDSAEQIILDQNKLAQGHKYFALGVFEVSPDHKLLIYSIDTTGSEEFILYIKNLESDKLYPESIDNTGYSIAWANDNKTFFYSILDETKRPYKLLKHKIGEPPENDKIIYTEKDNRFWLDIYRTKDGSYLIMDLGSHTTSELYYLNANKPGNTFTLIRARQPEIEYYVEHHSNSFYILTNDHAKNFKLVRTPDTATSPANWQEIIPHSDTVTLEGFEVFKNYLVVYEREKGLKKIRIINLKTQHTHYVDFPEPTYTFWRHRNKEFNTNKLRFTYTSLITPRSVYDYEMDERKKELKKQYEVLGGYNPADYKSERIFALAPDSTAIPISLVYRKDLEKNSNAPLYLTGYGAYGSSYDPYFSSNRLSLLNRGFIYAIAHIRGGGEMGREWYDQGKLFNKKNTFTDFIACAEHLVKKQYTNPEKLVISGGSAGGLLIGAVINMKPALFKIAIADVPFVDLINTMLDSTLPLTALEYEEWGNPYNKKEYEYMKSYSPYDNVKKQDYPNLLITAGLNDARVMYWEPTKWTAKLRALKTDNNLLLLKTNMGTGHLGVSGRYDYLKEIAFEYAFILYILRIK